MQFSKSDLHGFAGASQNEILMCGALPPTHSKGLRTFILCDFACVFTWSFVWLVSFLIFCMLLCWLVDGPFGVVVVWLVDVFFAGLFDCLFA